ncbi:DinB family protein [Arthrobacter sp. AL08]|uniref:DinB family protein n=1 Tax=unclassified Arthrobacter TaxID=235627 RepID=UPI002499F835|nr:MULTISPECIES: DinB family protein [unclassified Arthrobacter]MDI3242724.1 DinB family protein [Arthrobacter sp. AL05]MDI3278735.1 DinB family protein [Arthrobacter sp. AL08]
MDQKSDLHGYLRIRRTDLLAKLDGLGDYDVRRPLTPTGTNLLGLIKHVGSVQLGYFGEVFGRPSNRVVPWLGADAPADADMWAADGETRAEIIEFFEFSARHSDATIETLALDAHGDVPWWTPERRRVTLHQILVHMCVETARHAGHADILRELIDGAAGNGPQDPNVPSRTAEQWAAYRSELEAVARRAGAH